ncbi:MAG: PEP-CTERM sorting domain-containing protein [Fimbriimonadaceae bacterium]|nr:PEP-CTERM sorting domain-containing protein [Fimbriimonadaceae bacterium]
MTNLKICAVALMAVVGASAMAQTFTVATFADPTVGQNPAVSSMFSFNTVSNSLSGSWVDGVSVGNLSLSVLGTGYANTSLSMAAVAATAVVAVPGFYTLAPGSVTFSNISDANLLTISWNSGVFLNSAGFGASTPNVVSFSGTAAGAAASAWDQESFFFSFANTRISQDVTTYTASLTSSAVPEPLTMAALALGAGLVAARRRHKS